MSDQRPTSFEDDGRLASEDRDGGSRRLRHRSDAERPIGPGELVHVAGIDLDAAGEPRRATPNHRRAPRPHHRPTATEFSVASDAMASLAHVIAELVRFEVDARVRAALGDVTRPDEYLSTNAAGKLAQVAPGTVRRWIREGRLIGLRAGRVVRVRRSELEQLLRDGARSRVDGDESPEALALRDFG